MRKLVAFLVITSLLGIQGTALAQQSGSPCSDPMFLRLQSRPVEELTERQYRYVQRMQQECEESQRVRPNADMSWSGARDGHRGRRHGGHAAMWVATGLIVGSAVTAGVFLLADNHHGHWHDGFPGAPVPIQGRP